MGSGHRGADRGVRIGVGGWQAADAADGPAHGGGEVSPISSPASWGAVADRADRRAFQRGVVWPVCGGVRKVVDQVCADLPAVAHVEIDLDADPEAARKLSVLSLPTTLIFDADGQARYRASGVPTAAELRSALEPLLA